MKDDLTGPLVCYACPQFPGAAHQPSAENHRAMEGRIRDAIVSAFASVPTERLPHAVAVVIDRAVANVISEIEAG